MIDDSPRTAVLTQTDADALAALLSPRPSGSLFGPVIDLRQGPAKLQTSAKPLFDQPIVRGAEPRVPTIAKPIFERSKGVGSTKSTASAAPGERPRLAVQMSEAVPVGFVPAGEAWSRAPGRRWALALALLVCCGLVAAMFTLGGDGDEVEANGGPSSSTRSASSTLGVSTTLPPTTSAPATAVPTTTASDDRGPHYCNNDPAGGCPLRRCPNRSTDDCSADHDDDEAPPHDNRGADDGGASRAPDDRDVRTAHLVRHSGSHEPSHDGAAGHVASHHRSADEFSDLGTASDVRCCGRTGVGSLHPAPSSRG